MRIALCLSGLLGGMKGRNGVGKTIDPRNGHYWFNKNILNGNNVDVFIHTWDEPDSLKLKSLYNPKNIEIEKQKDFSEIDCKFYGFNNYLDLYNYENKSTKKQISNDELENLKNFIFRSSSKWYSLFKSIKLKKEFENKNKFKYDFVIISRFDIALKKKLDFSLLNKGVLYLSDRSKNQGLKKEAFNDLIFLGDSTSIDIFAKLYQLRHNYSIDPIKACYEHISKEKLLWKSILKYNEDTFILRWNQNLMKFKPNFLLYTKHLFRSILKK